MFNFFFPGEIEGVREAEGEGEGRRAVDCTSVLRSVLRKGTFRLGLRFIYIAGAVRVPGHFLFSVTSPCRIQRILS